MSIFIGKGLEILKVLTASDEKTILNAKAEMSHFINKNYISDEAERSYVLNTLADEWVSIDPFDVYMLSSEEILVSIIEKHIKANDKKFIVIFNRVMVHFYGMEFSNEKSLYEAMIKLTEDIAEVISEKDYD